MESMIMKPSVYPVTCNRTVSWNGIMIVKLACMCVCPPCLFVQLTCSNSLSFSLRECWVDWVDIVMYSSIQCRLSVETGRVLPTITWCRQRVWFSLGIVDMLSSFLVVPGSTLKWRRLVLLDMEGLIWRSDFGGSTAPGVPFQYSTH